MAGRQAPVAPTVPGLGPPISSPVPADPSQIRYSPTGIFANIGSRLTSAPRTSLSSFGLLSTTDPNGIIRYRSTSSTSTQIGYGALSQVPGGCAIGAYALSGDHAAIAVGPYARSLNQDCVAIGENSYVDSPNGISIGSRCRTTGPSAIGIGVTAQAEGDQSIAIGTQSNVSNDASIGLGYRTLVTGGNAMALGFLCSVTANFGVAIGVGVVTSNPNECRIGDSAGNKLLVRFSDKWRSDGPTQSTVGAAGGASALPATPTGYLVIQIGATDMVIPYYAKS